MTGHYNPTARAQLRFAAATFEDVQKERVVVGNRIAAAKRDVALLDADAAETILAELQSAEDAARKMLRATYRQVASPAVWKWQQRTNGVGEHLMALLLAEIGDPFVAVPLDLNRQTTGDPYERTLSDLWAYCGYAPRPPQVKGMTQEESQARGRRRAKRHVHLLVEQQLKRGRPLRPLYDAERAKASTKVDAKGEPWNDGHVHMSAARVVAKRLLRDLWRVRRDEYRAEHPAKSAVA